MELKERFDMTSQIVKFGTYITLLVDKETGIEYLFHGEGYAGGLTVLLDRDGKPKINENYK